MSGRPSKLSPVQWGEITRRLAQGDSVRSLAKLFSVSPSTISEHRFPDAPADPPPPATELPPTEHDPGVLARFEDAKRLAAQFNPALLPGPCPEPPRKATSTTRNGTL